MPGEIELLSTMLTVGGFARLSQEVTQLSGLGEDINDLVEEVKSA